MHLTESSNNPLVSMVLTTYNQGELAVAALESLFDQTYRPIEIIVSDDCSTNGTAEMLEKCVLQHKRDFKGGRVVFNKNTQDLGIVRNSEKAFRLAEGALIISCGGDDISYPQRAEIIVKKWNDSGRVATVIHHGFRPVSLSGEPTGEKWWKVSLAHPIGAAMAFSPIVVTEFPAVVETSGFEDNIFARRGYMLGDALFFDDVLVDYRRGAGVTSTGAMASIRTKISRAMAASARQNIIDLGNIRQRISEQRFQEVLDMTSALKHQYELELGIYTSKTALGRMYALKEYRKIQPVGGRALINVYLPAIFPLLKPVIDIARKIKVKFISREVRL